jgi:putative transposase
VSLPRQVLPGTTYLLTRRTAQRQFLLKPTVKSKQVVLYCFHRAARVHGVQIHALQVLDNHYHAVVTDPNAELPSFMAWVDREIAKCLNELYDRAENLWSDDHYSAVVHSRRSSFGLNTPRSGLSA